MKNKKIITFVLVAIILVLGLGAYWMYSKNNNVPIKTAGGETIKDSTYRIDGKSVTLVGGEAVTLIANSSSTITTKYFGNELRYQTKTGEEVTAFIVTQNTGGSGTFYYVVAALKTPNGYIGSDAFLLGDRIAPQTTMKGRDNIFIVNYAERKLADSFATSPSVGKSVGLMLDIDTVTLATVELDFTGEADPSRMTLGMKTWIWEKTVYSDGEEVKPLNIKKFTLAFKDSKTFSATTDCNGVGGEYSVKGSNISFMRMMSTLMYCENSQENVFSLMLAQVQSYHFTSKGELVFDLKFNSGSMIFR